MRRIIVLGIGSMMAFAPMVATASTPFTVENVGGSIGLGTADLKGVLTNLISWVLGMVALVAVVMIIIGGFQWLTSSGNEEKVEKAKKTISSAIIGIIIVILAWAIVHYAAGITRNFTT